MQSRNWLKHTIDQEVKRYNATAASIEKLPEEHPARIQMQALGTQAQVNLQCDATITKIHKRDHDCLDTKGQFAHYAGEQSCPTIMALVRKRAASVGFDPSWAK